MEQFAGYDEASFYEFLKMEGDPNVRIELPKYAALYENKHRDIAVEYAVMALFGQRLFDMEGNIYLKYPPMNGRSPFVFELKTEKRKALAYWLAWIAAFYEKDKERQLRYCQDAKYFVDHHEGLEIGCVDYVALSHQFWLMYEEEENRDIQ